MMEHRQDAHPIIQRLVDQDVRIPRQHELAHARLRRFGAEPWKRQQANGGGSDVIDDAGRFAGIVASDAVGNRFKIVERPAVPGKAHQAKRASNWSMRARVRVSKAPLPSLGRAAAPAISPAAATCPMPNCSMRKPEQ